YHPPALPATIATGVARFVVVGAQYRQPLRSQLPHEQKPASAGGIGPVEDVPHFCSDTIGQKRTSATARGGGRKKKAYTDAGAGRSASSGGREPAAGGGTW